MKRVGVLALLPLVLFALERVNLVKDASFEANSNVWNTYVAYWRPPVMATVSSHDDDICFTGRFSGSGDTRTQPGSDSRYEQAIIAQGFLFEKTIEDIDSLILAYCIYPIQNSPERTFAVSVLLSLNSNEPDDMKAGYELLEEDTLINWIDSPAYYLEQLDIYPDTTWHHLERNIRKDIENYEVKPIPLNSNVDSIILCCTGIHSSNDWAWHGQKVYFDDVRLMGYADYDVGVKEITSSQVANPGAAYTPEARIKNFGREDADVFSIIITLEDSTSIIRIDTVPYTLPADTEDTLTFDEVTFTSTGTYYMHVRTEMNPDECDEDDQCSIEISVTGVEEKPREQTATVELISLPAEPALVRYSLPANQSGALRLFNSAGRRINSKDVSGSGELRFDAIPAGVYFVRFHSLDITLCRKFVVVR